MVRLNREAEKSAFEDGAVFLDDMLRILRQILDRDRLHMGLVLTRENTSAFLKAIEHKVALRKQDGVWLIRRRLRELPDDLDVDLLTSMRKSGDLKFVLDRLVKSIVHVKRLKGASAVAEERLPQIDTEIVELEKRIRQLHIEKSQCEKDVKIASYVRTGEAERSQAELKRFLSVVSD